MLPGTWWSVHAVTQRSGTSFFPSHDGSFHIHTKLWSQMFRNIRVNQARTCMKTKLLVFFPLVKGGDLKLSLSFTRSFETG